ncbi:MAG: FtsW/RodA/SpoVE family cell cycle protein, partial [Patescibacteria group bacterium]
MNPRPSRPRAGAPDYLFIALVVFLVIFGLVMLASASSDLANARFGSSYYYLQHQLFYGFSLGIIGFLVGCFLYYRRLERFATPLLILSVIALILVFTPLGFTAKGSDRWIDAGFFTFQPSEIVKLTFFIYLAAWIAKSEERRLSFIEGFLPFVVLIGIVVGLLFLQPATTVAVLITLAALIMYFMGGARIRFIAAAALIGVLCVSLLISVTPYRMKRITSFFDQSADPQGS